MKNINFNSIKKSGILLLGVLLFSCSAGKNSMPVSESYSPGNRNGEIVWIDLVTNDAKESQKFFKELLGWNFKSHGAYQMALSGTKPIAGIIEDKELLAGSSSSYWVVSTAVEDVKKTSDKIKENGGRILSEAMEIEGRGTTALVEDDQGAYFSVMHNSNGYSKASAPRNGEWMWAELWTKDVSKAIDFYGKVLPIEIHAIKEAGVDNYYILKGASYEFAAITELPVKNESPIWVPILKVADPVASADKAVGLGGKILIKPTTVSGNMVALITTPDGAPFLLQEWN